MARSVTDRMRLDPAIALAVVAIVGAWFLGLRPALNMYIHAQVGVALAVAFVALALWRPETALVSYVGVLPLRDSGHVIPWASTDFATVIAVAGLVGLVLHARLESEPLLPRMRNPLAIALGAPFVAGVVTAPFSLSPSHSLQYAWRFLWLWASSLLFALGVTTTARLRLVLRTLVISCTALAILVAIQARYGLDAPGRVIYYMNGSYKWIWRPAGFYIDPNFTAVLLAVGVVVAAALALSARGWRQILPWMAAAGVCVLGVALTGSRTALVCVAAAAVLLAVTAPKGRRAFAIGVLVVGLVASIALVPQTLARVKSAATNSSEPSIQTRVLMARSMTEMLPRYWATGTGLAAFGQAYPPYRKAGALKRISQPHEVPLAIWVEMGIPGLLAEIAIAVCAVLALVRRARRGWLAEDSAVAAAFIVIAVGALFQYFYYFEPFWFVAGLVAAAPGRKA